jgi:hypothetical protein
LVALLPSKASLLQHQLQQHLQSQKQLWLLSGVRVGQAQQQVQEHITLPLN